MGSRNTGNSRGTIYFGWFALVVTSDALRMGTEIVPETSASFSVLKLLMAREDFINSCRRDSFISYIRFFITLKENWLIQNSRDQKKEFF
jgi:hypothetical protein